MSMSPNALNTVARIILSGLLVHMPKVDPRNLELILARVARLHREDLEAAAAAAQDAIDSAARAQALEHARAAEQRRLDELAEELEREKERIKANYVARKKPGGRAKKHPALVDELRAMLAEAPDMCRRDAMRKLNELHGDGFISYPGLLNYWEAAKADR